MAAIFYISSLSDPVSVITRVPIEPTSAEPSLWESIREHVVHITTYAGLMFWFVFALTKAKLNKENIHLQMISRAFFATMIYALSDEVHQIFVPGRGLDGIDLLLDAVGAGITLIVIMFLKHFQV